MEVFLDKNNNPNIIKSEEFVSRIYSVLLRVNSNLNANEIFEQALKLLNRQCSNKALFSALLMDVCIIRVLQFYELDNVIVLYIQPNIDSNMMNILEIDECDLNHIIWK